MAITLDGTTGVTAPAFTGSGVVPASTVIYVAQNTAPTGYVKANGAALSRTTYADLFAAIGTTFGSGDGSTTFNVPDLRGEFIRAWDDARGVDSGRSFGSAQADEFESHRHIGGFPRGPSDYSGGRYGVDSSGAGAVSQQASGTYTWLYPYTSTEGGSETRPRNIALLACIKY